LGLFISSRLSWSIAQKTLTGQASKAMAFLLQVGKKVKGLDVKTYLLLFDKMILPILLYGSEIWDYDTFDCIEVTQRKFCKCILKLPSNTPSAAVLGECGRYPIKVHSGVRFIKYWCKLIQMNEDR
jgi:hypothetical protein